MPDLKPRMTRSATEPGSAPPATATLEEINEIVGAWNRMIPKGHVRLISRERLVLIRMALGDLAVADVVAAIENYSRQPWQKRNQAWKTFDAFMEPAVLVQWYEAAMDAADKAAEPSRHTAQADPDVERWSLLPTAKKNEIWKEASKRLRSEGHATFGNDVILKRAIEMMKEEAK